MTTTVDRISGKYRRSNANFIERRRVHQLNERFDTLRQMLPPTGEKQSKVVVLTRSADLIRCQQQVIRDLMAQLDQLQHSLAAAASGFKPFDYAAASCPPSIDGPDRGSRPPPPAGGGYYGLPSVAISDFSADGKRGQSVPISAPGVAAGFKPESDVEPPDGHSSAPTSPKKTVSFSAATPEKNDSTAVSALMQLSASPPAVSDRDFGRYSAVVRKVRNSPVFAPYRRNLAHDFRAIAPNPPSVVAAAGAAASATAMSRNYLGWLQGYSPYHCDPTMYSYLTSGLGKPAAVGRPIAH